MKNLKPFEDYSISNLDEALEESSCLSENSKNEMKRICEEHLAKEAIDYDEDDYDEHTYDGYVEEAANYIKECLGRPGYASLNKPYTTQ